MILQNSCTTQNSLQIIVDYSPGVEVIQDILVQKIIYKLSSPGPKPLASKTLNPKTKNQGALADTKISWATTPPPHPITFKHEGGVPQKSQRVRKVQNGPPYLSSKKTQVDSKRKDME